MLDYNFYLKEIISTIGKIEDSVAGKDFEEFISDLNLFDATLMRIQLIGETIKSIPYNLKKNYKGIKWRKFSKLRDIISHRYSQVNKNIIWDITKELSELKNKVKEILEKK